MNIYLTYKHILTATIWSVKSFFPSWVFNFLLQKWRKKSADVLIINILKKKRKNSKF